MARSGPRKIARYGDRFKATAVKLSSLPGVLIQEVARLHHARDDDIVSRERPPV